jgi:hypothetical protein
MAVLWIIVLGAGYPSALRMFLNSY